MIVDRWTRFAVHVFRLRRRRGVIKAKGLRRRRLDLLTAAVVVAQHSEMWTTIAFLVATAAVTARADSGSVTALRGGGSLRPMTTLMDETIADRSGTAHVVYVRLAFSKSTCLHVDLRGRGSHHVQSRACAAMARAFESAPDCECSSCVITMGHSKGAAPTALPLVAKFVLAHRRHLSHVVVLEPRGVALKAVQIVKLLSAHDSMRIHRTFEAFEHAADRDAYIPRLPFWAMGPFQKSVGCL